jgi:thiamine kinase-like enzyme
MTPLEKVKSLSCWRGPISAAPLGGGITNHNFLVQDGAKRAVVRVGDDIAVHHILRFNELAASQAAFAAGISPAVLHHEAGALVIGYIDGRTMAAGDLRQDDLLDQALDLVARVHRDMPRYLQGPNLTFWVFHVIRDYARTLQALGSSHAASLPDLLAEAAALERAVGPIDMVFGHNDLLPANFMHDGRRMWLVDWDYAGWGSPLFDLGGLAANCALATTQEERMLVGYFGALDASLWRRYLAMKAAAALREALWSMVSELHSTLHFDYAAYTATTLSTYRLAQDALRHV